MYKLELAKFIFNSNSNPNLSRNHRYLTRNRNLLLPTYQRLTITQHSVFFKGVNLWNDLPSQFKSIDQWSTLKNYLKSYFINMYSHE